MLRSFIALVAIAALAVPRSAQAQPSAADIAVAKQQYESGKKAAKDGDYDTARRYFLQSLAVAPHPLTLWNLALVEIDSGHPVDGVRDLRKYKADPRAEPEKKKEADGLIEQQMKRIGRVKILVPSNVPVTLDGTVVSDEQRKDAIEVVAGHHAVDAGFPSGSRHMDLEVAGGKEVPVTFDSTTDPTEPGPGPGGGIAKRDEGGGLPCFHSGVCTGTVISLAAVGVAGIIGYGIWQGQANSATTSARGLAPPSSCEGPNRPQVCGQAQSYLDDHDSKLTLSRISLAVGAASLVGAGVVLLAWPRSTKETTGAQVFPLLSPGTAGMGVRGQF
ncbi:hypothetical protein LZC95_08260 [Pendulispora brunnea]|uniref:Tetratricopeptide repeat protein n=1 Tax=Pendulispora brunnea TaxID=2905690 RepID=A0ABZ2KDW2_9BACT